MSFAFPPFFILFTVYLSISILKIYSQYFLFFLPFLFILALIHLPLLFFHSGDRVHNSICWTPRKRSCHWTTATWPCRTQVFYPHYHHFITSLSTDYLVLSILYLVLIWLMIRIMMTSLLMMIRSCFSCDVDDDTNQATYFYCYY